MTEEFMAYLDEHPEYFYLIRDKQLMALIRELSKGAKKIEDIARDLKMDEKKLEQVLDDLEEKKVVTRMQTKSGETYVLDFAGQKILDLLERAKED